MFYPLKGYILIGRSNHKFEAGLGVKIFGFVFPDCNIGYKNKPSDNGFCFRAGCNGFILPDRFNNMLSLSIGYTF